MMDTEAHTVGKRAVRILLECFLVEKLCTDFFSETGNNSTSNLMYIHFDRERHVEFTENKIQIVILWVLKRVSVYHCG